MTFGPDNSQEDMDLYCQRNYSPAIQEAEIAEANMVTLLCEEAGLLIGFVQLRWEKAPLCVEAKDPAEIFRLYVVQPWHGKGIAKMLMDDAIMAATQRGSDVIWLGVWERNPRAIAFYKKIGFAEVGAHTFHLGSDPQRDIVMVRSISDT